MVDREPMPIVDSEAILPQESREKSNPLTAEIFRWWKGDAHTHSLISTREQYKNSDSIYEIREVLDYYSKLGLEFVCFAEHASDPSSPESLAPDHPICQSLLQEKDRITSTNKESKFSTKALSAVETNIFFNERGEAQIDIPPEITSQLDLVIASRHTIAHQNDNQAIKASLLAAAKDPQVDMIGHIDRYTNIEYQWNLLVENDPEAASFDQEMKHWQQKKKEAETDRAKQEIEHKLRTEYYNFIDKVIGKLSLSSAYIENEKLMSFQERFKKIISEQTEYWQIWPEIIDEMAKNNKAFEINLHEQPSKRLVAMAAERGLNFFINYDAHDFDRFNKLDLDKNIQGQRLTSGWAKGELDEEALSDLKDYKLDRLSEGPGVVAIRRLLRWIHFLKDQGVPPERVINSSLKNLVRFLTETRGKNTDNLTYLQEKFTDASQS